MTIPWVKPSDFGILGLNNDLAVMTDCQYGGRTLYMVRHVCHHAMSFYPKRITNLCHLSHVTDFNISDTHFDTKLCSGHLEQLAIACPNLQRLNLKSCSHCLERLQGLQAIASYCHHLQGLNIDGICITNVGDHILFWEILSNMKLIYLTVESCFFKLNAAIKDELITLYQKCCTIRGIQCHQCFGIVQCFSHSAKVDTLIFSYFSSLNYCNVEHYEEPTMVQDVISNCRELKYFVCHSKKQLLNLPHSQSLQEFYIDSADTDVPDDFMTSISALGGLVHVVMKIRSLTAEGITSLVRISPKLITFYLVMSAETIYRLDVEKFNETLKQMFLKRKLFTAGDYMLCDEWDYWIEKIRLREQDTHLLPLWFMDPYSDI